jgi:chromatin segregation and condensation protein Rec8/ScpA/Scc1 (kleisin family)
MRRANRRKSYASGSSNTRSSGSAPASSARASELPPRGGEVDALASAWSRVLALAMRQREEDIVAPGERYSVEQRTAEIEALIAAQERVSFATLLGDGPTIGFAVVTFIALLDLYRRGVIDLAQDELFADIVITRREATSAQI